MADDVASRKLTWPDRLNVGLAIVAIVIGVLSIVISWLLSVKAERDLDAVRELTVALQAQSESSFAKEQEVADAVLLLMAVKAGLKPSEFVGRVPVLVDSVNKLVAAGTLDEVSLPRPVATVSGSGRAADYFMAAERAAGDGRTKAAIALLDTAIQLNPRYQAAFNNRAFYKFGLGDTLSALSDADMAVSLDSTDPTALITRSRISLAVENYVGAITDCVRALALPGTSADDRASLFINKGIAERHRSRFADARLSLQAAHNLRPKDASIYINLANVANDSQKYAEAESLLTRAIVLDSTYGLAFDYRGNARYRLGNIAGALADHSAAVRLEPTRAGFLYDRLMDYRALGKRDSALADLRRAAKLDPTDPDVLSSLGLTLAEDANKLVDSGRKSEARAKWQEAVDWYKASLSLPRMSPDRALVVEHWLDLARGRFEELYGMPPDR